MLVLITQVLKYQQNNKILNFVVPMLGVVKPYTKLYFAAVKNLLLILIIIQSNYRHLLMKTFQLSSVS